MGGNGGNDLSNYQYHLPDWFTAVVRRNCTSKIESARFLSQTCPLSHFCLPRSRDFWSTYCRFDSKKKPDFNQSLLPDLRMDRNDQTNKTPIEQSENFALSVNGTQFTQMTTKTAANKNELYVNKNEEKTKLTKFTEEPSIVPISSIKPSVATNGYQLKAQFYSEDTKSRK